MPMPCSPEITPPRLRASAMMRATAALASCSMRVVVGVDRDVGVHVAVAGVHVQRDEHAAAQHARVDRVDSASSTGANARPAKISLQRRLQFALPRHDARVWSCSAGNVVVDAVEQVAASVARVTASASARASLRPCASTMLLRAAAPRRCPARHACAQLRARRRTASSASASASLLRDRQLDVDALDAVGVVAEARQRDHHVLVDLERVGVPGDGRGARAVEPELACAPRPTPRRSPRRRARWRCARPPRRPAPPRLRRRRRCRRAAPSSAGRGAWPWWRSRPPSRSARRGARGPRAARAAPPCFGRRVEVVLDLDDGRRGIAHLAEELEAHRADRRRHPVQDEARRGDDAVAAFLLHAGQAGEELVGDVLAETGLAKRRARDRQRLAARAASCRRRRSTRTRSVADRRVVDLAQVVVEARRPRATRRPASPSATTARLSSAVPHSTAFLPPAFMATLPPMHEASAEVGSTANTSPAASAASITRRVTTPAPRVDRRRRRCARPGSTTRSTARQALELLGVDHRRARVERDRAAGVAGAAAARDDGEAELDAALAPAPRTSSSVSG